MYIYTQQQLYTAHVCIYCMYACAVYSCCCCCRSCILKWIIQALHYDKLNHIWCHGNSQLLLEVTLAASVPYLTTFQLKEMYFLSEELLLMNKLCHFPVAVPRFIENCARCPPSSFYRKRCRPQSKTWAHHFYYFRVGIVMFARLF